jgi:hypothetical protein
VKDFTLYVEWDGGGEEALRNPEWRMKGDAPDKQGRVSHRDAKVNCVSFDVYQFPKCSVVAPLFCTNLGVCVVDGH